MGYYCTMIHGPCRGKQCDFWARTKIKKASIEDLVSGFKDSVKECEAGVPLNKALDQFWAGFGIKSKTNLCREEPALCEKMQEVERRVAD